MVKSKKYNFFYRCLAWHAIYLWLWIQIRDPSRFDNSTFLEKSILFFTLYLSLLMVAGTNME